MSPTPSPRARSIVAVTIARQLAFSLQRMRAEDARRRAEEELSDFFENASVALHWAGPDGTILRANRRELEMLGYGADEYIGRHISEFHVDQKAAADILARYVATARSFTTTTRSCAARTARFGTCRSPRASFGTTAVSCTRAALPGTSPSSSGPTRPPTCSPPSSRPPTMRSSARTSTASSPAGTVGRSACSAILPRR